MPAIGFGDLIIEFMSGDPLHSVDGLSQLTKDALFIRLRKVGHVRRKYFWHATNISGHNKKSAAGGLQNGDAERFGETGVQEDVASAENISNLIVRQGTQHLHSTMKIMLFNKLLKRNHAAPVTTYYEVNILEL